MTRSWARTFRPLVIALAVIVLVFATGCEDRRPKSVKGKGIDFTLNDLNGNPVSLKDFRGKVVLLDFWATFCPPCRESIPELIKLNERMKGRDFVILAISLDEREKDVRSFAEEYNILYTVMWDNADVYRQYNISSIPTTYLISRDGKIAGKHMGYGDGMIENIEREIEELLREEVPPPEELPEGEPQK